MNGEDDEISRQKNNAVYSVMEPSAAYASCFLKRNGNVVRSWNLLRQMKTDIMSYPGLHCQPEKICSSGVEHTLFMQKDPG